MTEFDMEHLKAQIKAAFDSELTPDKKLFLEQTLYVIENFDKVSSAILVTQSDSQEEATLGRFGVMFTLHGLVTWTAMKIENDLCSLGQDDDDDD